MLPAALIADQLSCRRGERILFSGLNFTLAAGEWLHVQGANGAGKTTLLRTLAGLSSPSKGRIRCDGIDLQRDTLYYGHSNALNDDLSAMENLAFLSALDGLTLTPALLANALHASGIPARRNLPCRHFSAGQKRRVLLARLRLRQQQQPARLLLLDEAFAALDAQACTELGKILEHHLAHGGLAVLTSHQPIPLSAGQVCTL